MSLKRASGILLHPTSLPGPYGIGDIGPVARRYVDWLAAAGQSWWEVLPLGPTGNTNSPFSAYSFYAGNPLLLSPQEMLRDSWLTESDLAKNPSFQTERVDFGAVIDWKTKLLKRAAERFFEQTHAPAAKAHFHDFLGGNTWLRRYALFMALKEKFKGAPWWEWPEPLRNAEPSALHQAARELDAAVRMHQFLQWQFFVQWYRLKTYAEHRGVKLLGNTAFYAAHDSADVWAHQHYFTLDEQTGRAEGVAGVPPDYFNEKGQRWGMPVYRFRRIGQDGWEFILSRMKHSSLLFDLLKLDHFRGYHSVWVVPGTARTAAEGTWQPGPGLPLFKALQKTLGSLPFVTEDLGHITNEINAMRDALRLPGLRVLQFGLESQNVDDYNMPGQYPRSAVAYTGTHDNNTFRGWFNEKKMPGKSPREIAAARRFALRALHGKEKDVTAKAVEAVWNSAAGIAIAPMQDILDLPGAARLNTPGRRSHNWEWRLEPHELSDTHKNWLKSLTKACRRSDIPEKQGS